MPVEVFGQDANGKVFSQGARTQVVSAHGALLILTAIAQIRPSILLVNKSTKTEVQCRVVYRKDIEGGTVELAVEFVAPQPRFWGIAFPPEDWSRADRKITGAHSK